MHPEYKKALNDLLKWHQNQLVDYEKGEMMSMAESTWGGYGHQEAIQHIKKKLKNEQSR